MSEAYFLSGSAAATPGEAIQAACNAVHARPAWVDEVYHLSARAAPAIIGALTLQDVPSGVPISAWANQPGLDGFILQAACRQLVAAERRLILVVQQSRARSVAVLLVNPQAVGAYNLAPQAQVHPGRVLPATSQPLDVASAALVAAQMENTGLNWLAGDLTSGGYQEAFPAARLVARTPAGLFFQLQAAVRSLKKAAPLALLVSGPIQQALRCFLLERL